MLLEASRASEMPRKGLNGCSACSSFIPEAGTGPGTGPEAGMDLKALKALKALKLATGLASKKRGLAGAMGAIKRLGPASDASGFTRCSLAESRAKGLETAGRWAERSR